MRRLEVHDEVCMGCRLCEVYCLVAHSCSSQESAIRMVCSDLERAYIPPGGEPIVGRLKAPVKSQVS